MPALQQRLKGTAKDLIQKYGQLVTVSHTSGSARNPVTGEYSTGTDVEETAYAVFSAATKNRIDKLGIRFTSDDAAIQTVKLAHIESESGAVLKVGYKVTGAEGVTYYINGITPIDDNDGGTIINIVALRV